MTPVYVKVDSFVYFFGLPPSPNDGCRRLRESKSRKGTLSRGALLSYVSGDSNATIDAGQGMDSPKVRR